MTNTMTKPHTKQFAAAHKAARVEVRDYDNLSTNERYMLARGFWPVTTPNSSVKRWEHPETSVTVQAANVAAYIAQVKAERERERRILASKV